MSNENQNKIWLNQNLLSGVSGQQGPRSDAQSDQGLRCLLKEPLGMYTSMYSKESYQTVWFRWLIQIFTVCICLEDTFSCDMSEQFIINNAV